MKLTLPLPPSMNTYWRTTKRGRMHLSHEGRSFKERASLAALAHGVTPISGDVSLTGVVYFKNRRRDLDNAIKPLLDALEGIAFANDRQVRRIDLRARIDRANPRVEVEVAAITRDMESAA